MADADLLGHGAHAPVRPIGGHFVCRLRQHPQLHLRCERLFARRPRLVPQQPLDAFGDIALLPAPNARLRLARAPHDRHRAEAVRRRQHDPRAPNNLAPRIAIRHKPLKTSPVRRAQINADVIPHGRELNDLRPVGKSFVSYGTLAEFPQSLQAEIADWLNNLAKPSFEDERDPLRPKTIRNYEGAIRRYLSRLIEDGLSPEDFTGLASLLEVDRIKRAIERIRAGRKAEEANPNIHVIVQALLSIFRHIEAPPGHPRFSKQQEALGVLRKVAKKVRNRQVTMVKKNKVRLAALSSQAAARMFRTLHLEIAKRHAEAGQPTIAQALEMQSATIHMLLLYAPLRISNLSMLDLNQHITRPAGGKPGPWRIAFEGSEMKNGRPYDGALVEEASQYLADYLARFHPVICKGRSTIIFPSSRMGLRKSEENLSKQYSGFVSRELGLRVNPHLLRHYAGMQWLDHMPGEYQPLSRLLAHSSSQTTIDFYTGAETKTAQTRWQGLLGDMIAKDKTVEAAHHKKTRPTNGCGDAQ